MLFQDIHATCPYCLESLWIEVSTEDGQTQSFVYDCEICCRPIHIRVEVDRDGEFSVSVKSEDEV